MARNMKKKKKHFFQFFFFFSHKRKKRKKKKQKKTSQIVVTFSIPCDSELNHCQSFFFFSPIENWKKKKFCKSGMVLISHLVSWTAFKKRVESSLSCRSRKQGNHNQFRLKTFSLASSSRIQNDGAFSKLYPILKVASTK